MHRLDLIAGLVFALIGVSAFIYAGQTLPMRAGMMPRAVSAVLAALGLALALRGVFGLRGAAATNGGASPASFVQSWPLLALSVLGTALYFFCVPIAGFILSTATYVIGLAIATGYRRRLPIVATAVGFSIGIDLVIRYVFLLQLPDDPLRTLVGLG